MDKIGKTYLQQLFKAVHCKKRMFQMSFLDTQCRKSSQTKKPPQLHTIRLPYILEARQKETAFLYLLTILT